MKNTSEKGTSGKRKGKGCLVTCLVIIAFAFYAIWEIGGPARRAGEVRDAIKAGMELEQVESILKQSSGRHYVWFQTAKNDSWEMVSRDEFRSAFNARPNGPAPRARLVLSFMGMAPNRVTFHVDFDGTGHVVKISSPHEWD